MARLLALVHKQKGISPGQRFRIEQWEPHLRRDHGITVDYSVYESPRLTEILYQPGHTAEKAAWVLWDTWRRRDAVKLAQRYDAVLVYREMALLGPAVHEVALARTGVPFILDFDDAIWMPNPTSPTDRGGNARFSWLRFPAKTAEIARRAAAVTVGNRYLAEWVRTHNPEVHVVPTTIDLERYAVQPRLEGEDPFVIVWMGSFSTLRYLELVRAPIERLARERPVEVRIVCDRPFEPGYAGATMTFVKWTAANEARDIGAAHVGIMPLDDTPYSRGKCACKALQYMAAGRPCVVAPVGVNADIVKHEQNGLLATSDDDWYQALRRLADSRELRDRLATAGRQTVEEGFSAQASAAKFARAVERAIASRQRTGSDATARQ